MQCDTVILPLKGESIGLSPWGDGARELNRREVVTMRDESRKTGKNIPLGLVAPVLNERWNSDEDARTQFAFWLEFHRDADRRDGGTCWESLRSIPGFRRMFSEKEIDALLPHVPEQFKQDRGVNQHYLRSLEQFYAEVQKAYDDHADRTERLAGTVQGRFVPSEPRRGAVSDDRLGEVS